MPVQRISFIKYYEHKKHRVALFEDAAVNVMQDMLGLIRRLEEHRKKNEIMLVSMLEICRSWQKRWDMVFCTECF